jgi:hypothetical protein
MIGSRLPEAYRLLVSYFTLVIGNKVYYMNICYSKPNYEAPATKSYQRNYTLV